MNSKYLFKILFLQKMGQQAEPIAPLNIGNQITSLRSAFCSLRSEVWQIVLFLQTIP